MKRQTYRTKDDHEVRSRAEVIIDNTLFDLGIVHEYEAELRLGNRSYKPDWYLSEYDLYIEFWGMEDDRSYQIYQREKQKAYGEYHIPYLSLADKDLEDRKALEERILRFINRYKDYKVETIGISELIRLEKFPIILFLLPFLYSFLSGLIGFSLIYIGFLPRIAESGDSIALPLIFPGFVFCYLLTRLITHGLNDFKVDKFLINPWKIVLLLGASFLVSYFVSSIFFRPLFGEDFPKHLVSFIIQPFGAWLFGGFYIIKYQLSNF